MARWRRDRPGPAAIVPCSDVCYVLCYVHTLASSGSVLRRCLRAAPAAWAAGPRTPAVFRMTLVAMLLPA